MLMIVFFVLALAAALLNGIVLISASIDKNTVEKLNWSLGKQNNCGDQCSRMYVGVYNFVLKSGNAFLGSYSESVNWSDDRCTDDFCAEWRHAMQGVIAFAAVTLVLCMPSIFTNLQRSRGAGNTGVNRTIGAVSSLLAVAVGVAALIWFERGCQRYLTEATSTDNFLNFGGDWAWQRGSVWILLLVVVLLKGVDLVGNLAAPLTSVRFCGMYRTIR